MMLRFLPLIVLLAACATEPLTPEELQARQAKQYCSGVAEGGRISAEAQLGRGQSGSLRSDDELWQELTHAGELKAEYDKAYLACMESYRSHVQASGKDRSGSRLRIGTSTRAEASRQIYAYEGASLSDDKVATVLGGGFPNLRSIDELSIKPNLIFGKPDTKIAAGPHTLVIDYQPCSNANSCGLTSVTADLVLAPGRSYKIRHLKDGCTLWVAVTSVTRRHETPCRNYLWIEDQITGETVWGNAPVNVEKLR